MTVGLSNEFYFTQLILVVSNVLFPRTDFVLEKLIAIDEAQRVNCGGRIQ